MGHQFIRLFGRGIERDRVINTVMLAERRHLVAAIDRGRTGIDQMLDRVMPTPFKNVHEAGQIGVDIGVWIFNRIADTGLGRQMDHAIRLFGGKNILHNLSIFHGSKVIVEIGMIRDPGQPVFLQ